MIQFDYPEQKDETAEALPIRTLMQVIFGEGLDMTDKIFVSINDQSVPVKDVMLEDGNFCCWNR